MGTSAQTYGPDRHIAWKVTGNPEGQRYRSGVATSHEHLVQVKGTTSILQSANLTWNNTSNTSLATNFVGSDSGITNLNYDNIATNKL
jgi:hypothetical protein